MKIFLVRSYPSSETQLQSLLQGPLAKAEASESEGEGEYKGGGELVISEEQKREEDKKPQRERNQETYGSFPLGTELLGVPHGESSAG